MNLKHVFVASTAAFLILGSGAAKAGQTINDVGAIACVNDKWNESEPDKGHKLVDYAGRCVNIRDDPAAPKATADCVGKYEYMPDKSWKGSGTCTYTFKGGDKLNDSWEEGSHLKEYTYKNTGGTGKYEGARAHSGFFDSWGIPKSREQCESSIPWGMEGDHGAGLQPGFA